MEDPRPAATAYVDSSISEPPPPRPPVVVPPPPPLPDGVSPTTTNARRHGRRLNAHNEWRAAKSQGLSAPPSSSSSPASASRRRPSNPAAISPSPPPARRSFVIINPNDLLRALTLALLAAFVSTQNPMWLCTLPLAVLLKIRLSGPEPPRQKQKQKQSAVSNLSKKVKDFQLKSAMAQTGLVSNSRSSTILTTGTQTMSDALSSMVKTRNVGFIVLDLRRIVRGLASGKVPNASRHFVVKKNPHVSVLRALASHGVPLRVSARAEVDFLTSLRMAHGSPSFELVEDYGFRSRKPDSFLLRMLAVGVVRFGVDAPTEVDRVERLVKKALERGTIEREPERLEYVACLGGNRAGWNEALEQLKTRCGVEGVVGVSVKFEREEGFEDDLVAAVEGAFPKGREGHEGCGPFLVDLQSAAGNEPDLPAFNISVNFSYNASESLAAKSGTVVAKVIGKKEVVEEASKKVTVHYFIDEGRYGSLQGEGLRPKELYGHGRKAPKNDKKVNVILWGPTCDGLDKVWGGVFTASLEPGVDWISFSGIGSSLGSATSFNGFEMAVTEVCVRGWERGGDDYER